MLTYLIALWPSGSQHSNINKLLDTESLTDSSVTIFLHGSELLR